MSISKQKRRVTAKFFTDGVLENTKQILLTVYRRKDGSEYVNLYFNRREVVNNTVECHAATLRAMTLNEIIQEKLGC